MVKVVWFTFKQCFVPLTCCLSKGPMKGDFLEIRLTTFFGVRNFGNRSGMRLIFFTKCSKFNLDFKNADTNSENVFCFWDKWMWIGCLKLSLLRRKCPSSAVNMLIKGLKTLHITKTDFFNSIAFKKINKYGKGGVVQCSTVLDPLYRILLLKRST